MNNFMLVNLTDLNEIEKFLEKYNLLELTQDKKNIWKTLYLLKELN